MRNRNKTTALFLFLFLTVYAYTADHQDHKGYHEIILYAFPSPIPIDWSSPSSLYRSSVKSYIIAHSTNYPYTIGHLNLELRSTLFKNAKYIGMASANKFQKVNFLLFKGVGLGILGMNMAGEIESEEKIKKNLSRLKGKYAAIQFTVSEHGMQRVLEFIDQYSKVNANKINASMYYNGATWPRYRNEGSGCTAFCMSILEIAGINIEPFKSWKVEINIPTKLIGRIQPENQKISLSNVLRTKNWHNGNGIQNIDFVEYFVYDPNYIYHWILTNIESVKDSSINGNYEQTQLNGTKALKIKSDETKIPPDIPIFFDRIEKNLFLVNYHNNLKLDKDE